MGLLYDACQQVIAHIDGSDLDKFKARGSIALQTGFLVSAVQPTDPDDPEKLEKLRRAAENAFGLKIVV